MDFAQLEQRGVVKYVNGSLFLKTEKIRESKVALRDVDRQSEGYLQLVESVRANGILNPIVVRIVRDPATGEVVLDEEGVPVFGLIDGLHRTTSARDVGLEYVPVAVKDMTEAEILDAQIIANLHKVETKPVQYTQHLLRILASNPLMTEQDLAKRLNTSYSFIQQRLSLTKLKQPILQLVDDGRITLVNAYALAKLPEEEQADFVDRAMTDGIKSFSAAVAARVKELKDAKIKGKAAKPAEFEPTPTLRRVKEIKEELDSLNIGSQFTVSMQTPIQGWKAGVEWVLSLDSQSVELSRAKYEARRLQREQEKEKRAQEKRAKKEEDAAKTSATVSVE